MSDYVVGLTGGIGSGKSAVADAFAQRGIDVVDTDVLAHQLTAPGGAALPALVAAFGADVLDAHGALDRAGMRRRVFADDNARRQLEAILHPMIRAESDRLCRQALSPYVILAVPLLFESGSYRERCDRILVVDCPESLQQARVMARNGFSASQVSAIMDAQATRAQRLSIADDVLVNDRGLDDLNAEVERLHAAYLGHAAQKCAANG